MPRVPFRGPTEPRVLQTVDVGAGWADWTLAQARKAKRRGWKRKYAVVDPAYKKPGGLKRGFTSLLAKEGMKLVRHSSRQRIQALKRAGVLVRGQKFSEFIDYMLEEGLVARHFNFDIPQTAFENKAGKKEFRPIEEYEFEKLFQTASRIMLANGKIFVHSENGDFVEDLAKLAKQHGFSTRRDSLPEFPPQKLRSRDMYALSDVQATRRGLRTPDYMRARYGIEVPKLSSNIHRLVITFGLKKALPDKQLRRNWPASP